MRVVSVLTETTRIVNMVYFTQADGDAMRSEMSMLSRRTPLLPEHAAQGVPGLSDAEDGVAVDELDVAELGASPTALDEADPDEPSIDHSCWGRTPIAAR